MVVCLSITTEPLSGSAVPRMMEKRVDLPAPFGPTSAIRSPRLMLRETSSKSVRALPSWFSRDWLWGLILVLAVILTYQPVWWAGFIWDDDVHVTANPCIVGPLGLKEIWTTSAADICPLTLTTFWVEHALWGLAPLPYHLVNVLLHGACAVLLWRVLRSLQVPGAWLGAALWALHPVQVESVAWITEMKNTESGLFFLLSILFFVRWLRARDLDGRTGGGWNYALTLLFAALAMASKSSTVILPVVLCLCAWWVEGRWHWRNLARVAPIFLMSIAASALSMWTQGAATGDSHRSAMGADLAGAPGDGGRRGLVLSGQAALAASVDHHLSALADRCRAVVLVSAAAGRDHRPVYFVAQTRVVVSTLVFRLRLFPGGVASGAGIDSTILFFVIPWSLIISSIWPAWGRWRWRERGWSGWRISSFQERPWLQSSLCAGLLLILGILSWQRAWVYESEETLWTDTLAKNPNCWVGHNNLGVALFQKGQVDEAMAQLPKGPGNQSQLCRSPQQPRQCSFQKGQVDEAMAQYQKALEINPNYAEAHNNLGNALFKRGRWTRRWPSTKRPWKSIRPISTT
jgi:hypothetical protein